VVEVDGGCHAERRQADRRRDAVLEALGWRVVRVDAEMVMRDVAAAVALVRAAL
jgi:very-short-patch-repair endonuclease